MGDENSGKASRAHFQDQNMPSKKLKINTTEEDNNSLDVILQRYHNVSDGDGRKATVIHEPKISECASSRPNGNFLQRVERYFRELNFHQLTVDDLAQLEIQMENALGQTRAALVSVKRRETMEQIRTLQDKEKMLREENELLQQQITVMLNSCDIDVDGYQIHSNSDSNNTAPVTSAP